MREKITIRDAKETDLESIFLVERKSYPPELQATHEAIMERFEIFGIRIAELNGELAGFYTCVPIRLNWSDEEGIVQKLAQNRNPHYTKWFKQYKLGGRFNTLYVTSTAVSSQHQGRGIGKKLVLDSLGLAEDHNLEYRASVLRVPGFLKWHKKGVNIDAFLEMVRDGNIPNPLLNLYLSLGFSLGKPIENYERDRTSSDYGVFAFKKITSDGGI